MLITKAVATGCFLSVVTEGASGGILADVESTGMLGAKFRVIEVSTLMKVFISWSGEVSHTIASILKEWLPHVIQEIRPWMSSGDIPKGARWSFEIASQLNNTDFGILCVTQDNMNSQWLNFEAGALSKSVDHARVIPFLFGVHRADLSGPMAQFQSVIFSKEDLRQLIGSLNAIGSSVISEPRLDTTFDVWWPRLDEALRQLEDQRQATSENVGQPISRQERILEEVLELTRTQQAILVESIEKTAASHGRSDDRSNTFAPSLEEIVRETQMLTLGLSAFLDRGVAHSNLDAPLEADLDGMPAGVPPPNAFGREMVRNLGLFQLITRRWPVIVSSIGERNRAVQALLKWVRPAALDDQGLVLMVPYSFHKDRLEDTRNLLRIQEGIQSAIGFEVNVRIELSPSHVES